MSVTENDDPGRDSGRGQLTAGIDWASEDHAVSIVDGQGVECERFTIEHTAAGLRRLVGQLRRNRVTEVAIERPDGPVVDALLAAGLIVLVIAPNQVRGLRGRYGSAGNKDDRFDAFVLADTVRTDRARLQPLTADSAAMVTLRMMVRTRKDLIAARVAMANQLRAAADHAARRGRPVPRHRQPDQPAVPDPLSRPRTRPTGSRRPTGELAARRPLQQPASGSGPAHPLGHAQSRHTRSPWHAGCVRGRDLSRLSLNTSAPEDRLPSAPGT